MPQNTNLNVSPYFDDFDRFKNYNKVLFKPGTPIQARELTTLQSILQDQIEQFGKHFFQEGSVVIPGQIAYDSQYTSVQIDDNHLGIPVSTYIDNFIGLQIKGETSGVTAKVENIASPFDTNDVSNYTLYIKYQKSSDTDFTTKTFIDGENLISLQDVNYSVSSIRANTTFATSVLSNSTSVGSAAKIAEGVYFIRGFFVSVSPQTQILDYYTNNPTYRVGLLIDEEIAIASNEYKDLYDNASGFSNYAAPGADRLKITATLIKKAITDFNDENFIELLRVENGILQKFKKDTQYSIIGDELARRTYDQSGDYYVKDFTVSLNESLNNKIGNNGIYNKNQQTKQGNNPSNDLACISISPGKAYVRGYEIETISNTILDLDKPRTTDTVVNESVPFSVGRQILLNNAYGSFPVGFGTIAQVDLYSDRTSTPGSSSGNKIGVARVYDLKLKNVSYADTSTQFECSLYDIQTYTTLTLNTSLTQSAPAYIQGKNSAAKGYLVSSVNSSNTINLYQVSGSFISGEQITINGIDNGRTIASVRDYNLTDVHQLYSANTGISTFTADPILSKYVLLSTPGTQFTITGASGGISTVSTSDQNFYVGINTGDIVSYTKTGDNIPTYNKVSSVNTTLRSLTLSGISSVYNVCSGTLPSSTIFVNDFKKVTLDILNTSSAFLYANLSNKNISNLDLTNGNIVIKKSYSVTVPFSGSLPESDTNLTLVPYSDEDYNLTFTNGAVESLNNQKISNIAGRSLTISNTTNTGNANLVVTYTKVNTKVRKKIYNRCSSIIINKTLSGVSTSTNGLTISQYYGLRVEDNEISLNVCDVESVLGVFESSSSSDPSLPKITLTNLNSNIFNSIQGEKIIGSNSNAVASLVSRNGSNQVELVYLNENTFIPGETVTFDESQIIGIISVIEVGDKNIKDNFTLDNGQRSEYLDFSRIVRNPNTSSPAKKLKIIFNYYTIDSTDPGDFVGVTSYDKDRYSFNIPSIDTFRVTDLIDLRPRVSPYTAYGSPFEYNSRIFSSTTSSSQNIFAKNKTINLSYSYYLPRIDKLFLSKDGSFIVNKGVPALNPKVPDSLDTSLEVATIFLPAYLYNIKNAKITIATHKRYTMRDISILEDRLSNVEYYTSLSLLETDTQNLTIRDAETGLDRFKCGFFVDNFKSFNGGDISNKNYKASIDTSSGLLKPQTYSTSIDLLLGSEAVIGIGTTSNPDADLRFVTDLGSPDIKKVGSVICLNYSDVEYTKNKFATRTENINPFNNINWIGSIELNPSSDTWIDTRTTKKTIDLAGSYDSFVQELGVDTNTGLSPVDWGAWETSWTGTSISQGPSISRLQTGSSLISDSGWVSTSDPHASLAPDGVMRESQTETTTFRDSFVDFSNQTVTTSTGQSRQGIQYGVTARYDSARLGDRVVSREIITTMRSRNIEIVAKRLKPSSRFYAFFDNVDVTSYIIPKLLEVSMISGTFANGETIVGTLGSGSISIKFRLATQNHKYGPYNLPTETYSLNPYQPSNGLSNTYTSTTTILNVDTGSLELQSLSGFFGSVSTGMQLVGQKSNAIAKISNLRLITDSSGTFIGSLFIPDPSIPSAPAFQTGTKTLLLTTSSTNSTIVGVSDSSAETNFTSAGTLDNVEDATLRLKNASVERITRQDQRTLTDTTTKLVTNNTFTDRSTDQTRWVDPLAESFEVNDSNGVYITKCDVFFRTKDTNNIPVTLQIRTMQSGFPSQTILPFGEVVLDPSNVNISEDASVATTFTFESPIYLEKGNSYAIVLIAASNSYNVWISRMGEIDVSTINKPDSEKIIVSQQPTLGSLFKSQNASTWDASQLEDLKFVLYRAEFTTNSASVRFYNPDLDIGNNQIVSLRPNPLTAYSKSIFVGIGKSLTSSDITNLNSGSLISQNNNSYFSGNLRSVVGAIGIGSTLSITNSGYGYTSNTTWNNVNLKTITGFGKGATANLTISNNVAVAATVSIGGSGYAAGDTLTIDSSQTGNFGKNLILTIPNNSGIISSFNSLIIDNVQGNINVNGTDTILSNGTTITNATVSSKLDLNDGLYIKVHHQNHGLYASNNYVALSGIESDLAPVKISSSYSSSSSSDIQLTSVGILTTFENVAVSLTNAGYILINKEIISYTSVNTSTNTIGGISRGIDSTIPSTYDQNTLVFKYEFNGVSLRRINKTHSFSNPAINFTDYPISLDSYHVKVDTSNSGLDRSSDGANGPQLFFNSKKNGGSYLYNISQSNSLNGAKASQNIAFNIVKPNIQTLLPETTSVETRIRTITGTSVNGNEISFKDNGFETISLNSNNFLNSTRIICSKENEKNNLQTLPGNKSLTLEMNLSTQDPKVSPMIDLDRVNLIAIMNRIDTPISDFTLDPRVNELTRDPNSAIYVSKIIKLDKASDSLKVLFDAYRHPTNDIRVLYRLLRNDSPTSQQYYELFPGYDNLNNGLVINPSKNNGKPDRYVAASTTANDFGSYEFTAKNLALFNGFQIKIIMNGTNQAFVPAIRDLRVIATV